VFSNGQGWALFGQQMVGAQNYNKYHHSTHALLIDRDMEATSIIR